MNLTTLAVIRLAASGAILNSNDRLTLIHFLEEHSKLEAEKFHIGIYKVNGDTYRRINDLAKQYNAGQYDTYRTGGNPKINAIKLLREAAGIGLKEAKDAIDFYPGFPSPPQKW